MDEKKAEVSHLVENQDFLPSFQTWVNSQIQNPLTAKGAGFPCENKYVYCRDSSRRMAIYPGNYIWGKGNTQFFQVLLDIRSEVILILRIQSAIMTPFKIGAYVSQVISWILTQACLTISKLRPWINPAITPPTPKCINRMDILSNLQNNYIGSLTCRIKVIIVQKASRPPCSHMSDMCKSPKLHHLFKIVYQSPVHSLGGMADWCRPRRHKRCRGVAPIVCLFNLSVWPLKKWVIGKTVYCCKLSQVTPPNCSYFSL